MYIKHSLANQQESCFCHTDYICVRLLSIFDQCYIVTV